MTTRFSQVLLIRGSARLQLVEGIVPEYIAAAERYFGREQGEAWIGQLRKMISQHGENHDHAGVGRIAGLFKTRFPSALSA